MKAGRIAPGLAVAGILVAVGSTTLAGQAPQIDPRSVAPYVPTPWDVVDRMLQVVEVSSEDVVYDLGSGDGRIPLRSAKQFGARSVGFEINADLVQEARLAIAAAGVQDRAKIVEQDIYEADLSPATVVTIFLTTSAQRRLRPKLERELRPGSRIACYKWEIPGWNPVNTVTVQVMGAGHPIYVYQVGQQR